jgi:hypothetical protein
VQPARLARPDREIGDGAHPGDVTIINDWASATEVLVVGTDDWAISDASGQLEAAGRAVHHCYESSETPFPCNALIPGVGCPLDQHQIDVVVNIRTGPGSGPTMAEMGAICGLRANIPLVVAGLSDASEFAPWADRVPLSGDIVSTCDETVRRYS